jgi:26S proteasome regulatory subunit N12
MLLLLNRNELPQSAAMYEMLGLNLLYLLSQNRLAEFHSEVELLPHNEIQTNVYLKHPISIEQYLMEGSYNKVCCNFRSAPHFP